MADHKADSPPDTADTQARIVDIEKQAHDSLASDPVANHNNNATALELLELPSSASRGWPLLRSRLPFMLRVLAMATVFFVISGRINRESGPVDSRDLLGASEDSYVSAYWQGIAEKGLRAAIKGHKHHGEQEHGSHDDHGHKHHRDKHDHGHGPGKHRHGPLFIPPKQAERIFLSVPNNDSVRDASRRYTSHAHIAGSGWDYLSAIQLKAEWESALGLHVSGPEEHVLESGSAESQARVRDSQDKIGVWVDTYYPYMNTPVESKVTLYTAPPFHAQLKEDIIPGDPDSQLRDEVRAFHGLSANGDVTAKYVYAGYGRKKDYEMLAERGIDLNGKIVLVKYGGVFRGLKVEAAQDAGAIGVIVFTDPGDDGEFTEDHGYTAYPDGPARQPSSIQRGSVQFLSKYPGDPTTPNIPSYRNVTRSPPSSMPRIPSLPISFQDAIPLLLALNGKGIKGADVSADWNGGLGYKGVEYWVGPSEVDLRLRNEVNNRVMPIWNTMATIPGHISDEIVIVGNHRDAWVLGAGDPSSGTASLTELVKGLGALLRKGWRPMRTIILASWDAEEYGLMGSTEFAEDHGDWLANRTAAYLNMDESVTGSRFAAGASPSLAWLLRNAATDVLSSSNNSKTVWDARHDQGDASRWTSSVPVEERSQAIVAAAEEELMRADDELSWIRPLGSGSDFTPFLQHYGIASGNIGFTGGKGDSVYHYHSVYDSFTWQEKFADPGFHKHVDAAKVLGLMTLRLADSPALPVNTTHYAHELLYYLHVVSQTANATGIEQLDLAPLHSAIQHLIESSSKLDARRTKVLKELKHLLPKPHHGKRTAVREAWEWCISALPSGLRAFLPGNGPVETPFGAAMKPFDADPSGLAGIDKTDWPEIPLIDDAFSTSLSRGPADDNRPMLPAQKHHAHPRPHLPRKQRQKIAKALKELRGINQNVKAFERGFISESGIKGREWYRHKGVAPGKWLGYGATTFPALTEALTLDRSAELAQKEADELVQLITDMSHHLAA